MMEAYEVEQDFSGIGLRTLLLNARKVFNEKTFRTTILLAIEDIMIAVQCGAAGHRGRESGRERVDAGMRFARNRS